MSDVKQVSINDIRRLSDLEVLDPNDCRDLFDIIVRRDTNFKTGANYNIDPDFDQFSVLCHSYFLADNLSISQLITSNYETVDKSLDTVASKMQGQNLYFMLVSYNKDGSVKDSKVLSGSLVCMAATVSSERILTKIFIFNIEH